MKAYNGFSPNQRMKAFRWLKVEIAEGRRTEAAKCDLCGQTHGVLDLHSEDYSGPPFGDHIGEFQLCWPCHMMIHCRFRNPKVWEQYTNRLTMGMQPPGVKHRNFRGWFVPQILGMRATWVERDVSLDEIGDSLGRIVDIEQQGWKLRRAQLGEPGQQGLGL